MDGFSILEEKIAAVYGAAFELEDGFAHDRSFLELGGNSIGVMKLQIALRKLGYRMRIDEMYELGSVLGIAEKLAGKVTAGNKAGNADGTE